jgi:hypothetical protein
MGLSFPDRYAAPALARDRAVDRILLGPRELLVALAGDHDVFLAAKFEGRDAHFD